MTELLKSTAPVRVLADPLAGVLGQSLSFDRSGCRTLADVIAKVPLNDEALRPHLRIRMGGEIIDPALYRRVLPKADTYLTVVLPLHGGDNNLLLTIASVALVAGAALVSGGALVPLLGSGFAAGTIGANLAAAGLSLAGSLLLQGLAAKPATGGAADRETVGSASAQNAFEPGAYLARVMGARRVTPQMVIPPYTTNDGKDQLVTAVYGLAGPHALSEIKVGDADITTAADIEYEIREGFAGDSPLTLVTQTIIEKQPNLTLSEFRTVTEGANGKVLDDTASVYEPYWHRVESGRGVDQLRLMFALPQGLSDLGGDGSAGVTSMRFRIRKKGTSTWYQLPELFLKAKAPGIPIRFNMEINWVASGAMPSSSTAFPTASFTDEVRGWYAKANRWPVTGTLRWAAATYFTTTYPHAISYVSGQLVTVHLDTTTFPQDAAYEVEMIRGFPGLHDLGSGWSATDMTYVNYDDFYTPRLQSGDLIIPRDPDQAPSTIVLTAVQSIWDEYPFDLTGQPTCLLAIRARNRSLGQVTALAEGYTEDWNGSTWVADQLTRNPASWRREVLRSEFNAEPVPDSLINMAKLVEWHEWCEAEGHELSLVAQGQPADELGKLICQAGFARPIERGVYDVVIDKPRDQVGLVTLRNAAGFSFEKPFGRMPHALKVQLVDEDDDYKQREVIVYADGYAAVAGGGDLEATRFESVEYPGITNEAQATKRARRDLRFGKHRSRLLSFTQDFEHLEFAVGDLVGVETDLFGRAGGRGRVKEVLLDGGLVAGLRLDEERDFTKADADAVTRGVQIRLDDGSIVNYAVTADDSDLNAVVFATPFAMPTDGGDDLIGPGTLLATGALERVTLPVLLWDMAPGPDLTCQVVALDYAAEEVYGVYTTQIQPMALSLGAPEIAEIVGEGTAVTPLELDLAGQAVGETITEPVSPMALTVGTPDVGLVHAATAKYLDQQADISANSTTRTIAINGGARTGKSIIVLSSRRQVSDTNVAPSSVTLNGVAMSLAHSVINARHFIGIYITTGDVTTDGTDSIVATWASFAQVRTTATIYPADGLSSTTPTAIASGTNSSPNLSLAVSQHGLIIAGAFANTTTAHSWTGLTENVDNIIDSNARASAASLSAAASAGTVTISATLGTDSPVSLSAAFR